MKQLTTYLLLLLAGIGFLIQSCGNGRHTPNNEDKLPRKSEKELTQTLFKQGETQFTDYIVRIGVDLESTAQDRQFSCYVKMRVDSAFSGSIKSGPIVAATYMVTTDSVFLVNKFEDCYFAENLIYISSLFGTTVEYDFFQDLILAEPVGLDSTIKYTRINDEDQDYYILSSHKKRDFKRLEQDKFEVDDEDGDMLIKYLMNGKTLLVDRIEVEIPSDTASITIEYLQRKEEDGIMVPEETLVRIKHPKDSVTIKMNYGSTKLNEPRKIDIKIPDDYPPCK